jgi:hypothetical protein
MFSQGRLPYQVKSFVKYIRLDPSPPSLQNTCNKNWTMFVIQNMDSKPEPSLCAFSQLKFKWIPSILGNLKEKSSRTTSEFSVIDKKLSSSIGLLSPALIGSAGERE